MIFSQLRGYLRAHKRAALVDIANRFDTEPDALRAMLNKWIIKGKVRKLPAGTPCHGCCQCDPLTTEIYEWIE